MRWAMAELSKTVATNRKASHDYHIDDRFEAGLVLTGSEIKSIRSGSVNIRDGYVTPRGDELWLVNVHIAAYTPASRTGHDPLRPRKLLLHRREIDRLISRVHERGFTIIPLRLYLKNGIAKIEIGLARGKRQYDKRAAIAKRDSQRQIERVLKQHERD
jgi:SsrA-binding protein